MRKLGILSMIVLVACSAPGINVAPTNPPPQATSGPAHAATDTTITPTLPTPTYTSTPTLSGIKATKTLPESSTSTFTPLPLIVDTPTPYILFTADTPGEGFNSVEISGNEIFWGICKPGVVKITAEVAEPDEVYNVVIFVRLLDGESSDTTPWSKGAAMDDHRNGTFTYNLNADTIPGKSFYRRAWVLYQLVATDLSGKIIGRTKTYTKSLTLKPCP